MFLHPHTYTTILFDLENLLKDRKEQKEGKTYSLDWFKGSWI